MFRYTPPQDPKGLITPYAEIRQLDPPQGISSQAPPTIANGIGNGGHRAGKPRSFSVSHAEKVNYDFLNPSLGTPPLGERNENLTPASQRNNNSSMSYMHVSSSPLRKKHHKIMKNTSRLSHSPSKSPQTSPARLDRKSFPSPSAPSREDVLKMMEGEDMDTYVYMAPINDMLDAEVAIHDAERGKGGVTAVDTDPEPGSEVRYNIRYFSKG